MANRQMLEGMAILSGVVGGGILALLDAAVCGAIDWLWPGAGLIVFAPLVVTQVVSFLVWGMLDVAKQRRREEEAERQARPWQQMAFGFDEPRELG